MADFELLKELVSGEVIASKDAEFNEELSKVWNGKLWKSNPLVFVKVRNSKDVSETLGFCATNQVPKTLLIYGQVYNILSRFSAAEVEKVVMSFEEQVSVIP